MAEKLIKTTLEETSLDYIILRATGSLKCQFLGMNRRFSLGLFGPGDFYVIYELMQMVNQGILFFIPGSGTGRVMWTFIDDTVDAFMLSIQGGKPKGTYIIASDFGTKDFIYPSKDFFLAAPTTKEWLVALCQQMGRMQPMISIPIPVCKLVIGLIGPIMNLGKKKAFMYKSETIDRMEEGRLSGLIENLHF